MADFLIAELKTLGATDIQREELGKQTLEGQELDLPPAVLATYGEPRPWPAAPSRSARTSTEPSSALPPRHRPQEEDGPRLRCGLRSPLWRWRLSPN